LGLSLGSKYLLHLPPHFLFRDKLTLIKRSESLPHLAPEPLIMIEIRGHHIAHKFIGLLAVLRRDLAQLSLNFRAERDFHTPILMLKSPMNQYQPVRSP